MLPPTSTIIGPVCLVFKTVVDINWKVRKAKSISELANH